MSNIWNYYTCDLLITLFTLGKLGIYKYASLKWHFNFLHYRPVNENISEVSFAEDLFPEEIEDVEESEIEGVIQVQTPDEAAKLSEEQMFLCSHESLIALSKMSDKDSCRTCKKPLSFHEKTRGSAVYFKWVCLTF